MNLKIQIDNEIEQRKAELEALRWLLQKLPEEGIELERAHISLWGPFIDFNSPTRKDVEKIMYFFKAGKWEKTPAGARINYTSINEYIPGYKLRLWCADPPGTCKIIKEEVEVPAQPPRKEIRERLECTPAL
jgi:hypothetical protein